MVIFRALSQSLISKFTFRTGVVLLITISLFAFFNITTLKEIFLLDAKDDIETVSEIILHTTHFQMLEDNRSRVYQMMEEVCLHEKIDRIRLFSTTGLVHFSTCKEEIGKAMAEIETTCDDCNIDLFVPDIPSLDDSRRIFHNAQGEEILSVTTAIHNKPSCFTAACHVHPPDVKTLGFLEVQGSLAKIGVQASSYRNSIATFGITLLLLVIICLSWMTQSLVIHPVHDLLLHAHKVSNMELDSRLQLKSNDEIGELSEAFNDMTAKLKKATDEYRDLTETLEAKVLERTEKIAQVSDQLVRSEKLASLGQLVAGIAHEINNPLTGILMFANMFAQDQRLEENQREDALTIVHETNRCADIVRRLLDFSRTSIPDKRLRSLSTLMESTLALVTHHATVNDVEIVRHYGVNLPDIDVDPNQIEQVFINLLVNACHAMPMGGRMTIGMRRDLKRDLLITTIEDTGHGISEENLGRIFDPFFTTKNQELNGVSGTGLGLSVSYGIIHNHGGQITVQSVLGQGTVFTVELPISSLKRTEDVTSTSTNDILTA
ncbi:MAG: ATP-binding protein [Desulfuromonadales bacterium]|nr:ATP-binding protein [Desulfuromonadales bacterium]